MHVIFSQLDLGKNKKPGIFRNDIYLPKAAGEIAPDYPVPFLSQVFCGFILAEFSALSYIHQCIFLKKLMRCMGDGPYSRKAS